MFEDDSKQMSFPPFKRLHPHGSRLTAPQPGGTGRQRGRDPGLTDRKSSPASCTKESEVKPQPPPTGSSGYVGKLR